MKDRRYQDCILLLDRIHQQEQALKFWTDFFLTSRAR